MQAVGDTGKFQEDMTWSNARLGLMTAACAIALFGQFNPYPFPDNRWLLAGCVVWCGGGDRASPGPRPTPRP